MARRGIFAEMQHQARVAQREQDRNRRAAVREHEQAVRRAEKAREAEVRAQQKAERAAQAERKRLEREAIAAHVASMEAQVEELNSALLETYDEIDGLLVAALEDDSYIDLEALKLDVEHPPFDSGGLDVPLPEPDVLPPPPEPVYEPPATPSGLLGRKKRHAEAVAQAEAEFKEAHKAWETAVESHPALVLQATTEHASREAERLEKLAEAQARYEEACAEREAEVTRHNAEIDQLINDLGYGTVAAVQEYVAIVLSNSIYPESFDVAHEAEFHPDISELRLQVQVPSPDQIPSIKAYKYTKSSDEISTTSLSQKACKDRYAGAVQQAALRALHDVFQADRRGLIQAINVEVGTTAADPATGQQKYMPFIVVAVSRDRYKELDLSAVVPSAALEHLGASVSKNPFGLVGVDTGGVRRT